MKQVIIVRKDIKMPPGKLAAQVGHACVEATLESPTDKVDSWRSEGMKKVVLKIGTIRELVALKKKAIKAGLTVALIKDAGHTVFKSPTITCLGIGPDDEGLIDEVTGDLQML